MDITLASSPRDGTHGLVIEEAGPAPRRLGRKAFFRQMLATMGPGLMVCFADTDGSCLITAADSGSKWNYKLLLLQCILVPVLYWAQELTVRLAMNTGKGMIALLRIEVGRKMAWAIAVPLLADAFLALISEITVFGQTIHACWGIPLEITNTLFTLGLIALALSGSYNVAEKVGLAMGVLQVAFFVTMFWAGPSGSQMWQELWQFPIQDTNYIKLVTANIGAVIMPWMLAYQQSALCEKGVAQHHSPDDLLIERIDTAIGSLLTQGVMAAVLITVAASPKYSGEDIENIGQLLDIFADLLGSRLQAKWLLTFAVCGACTVAAIVVTLCGAWALEEALGREVNMNSERLVNLGFTARIRQTVMERPSFFAAYIFTCAVAWFLSVATPGFANSLTGVWTQFVNGLLMPPVIFTLWYLAAYKLPEADRLGPCLKWTLAVVFGICSAFCLASIPFAIQDASS